jgi:hypothetical protein
MLDPRLLVTVAVTALLLWQPIRWIFENRDATLHRAQTFYMAANHNLLANYASGLWAIVFSALQVIAPLAVVYAAALYRRSAGRVPDDSERIFVRALLYATAFAIAICILLVLGFEVTQVKERWLHPLLYGMPIAAALWSSWRLPPRRLKAVLIVAGVCAIAVIVMLPARTVVGPVFGRTNLLNAPFADLAARIRTAGFDKGGILANSNKLGGNLRLQFPADTVVTPEYPNFDLPDAGPYLLVWKANSDGPVPGALAALLEQTTGRQLPPLPPRYVTADMLYSPDESMRLGFVILP